MKSEITKDWKVPEGEDCLYTNLFGEIIHPESLGLVYLCDYDHETYKLTPTDCISFKHAGAALEFYANTPNPASQLVYGKDREEFEQSLEILHKNMLDEEWQKELANYL